MKQIYTIDQERLYKLFKKILDSKYPDLSLNTNPHWKIMNGDVDLIGPDGDSQIQLSGKTLLVPRSFYWFLMEIMPISYKLTNEMFVKYFKDRFPTLSFTHVIEI